MFDIFLHQLMITSLFLVLELILNYLTFDDKDYLKLKNNNVQDILFAADYLG